MTMKRTIAATALLVLAATLPHAANAEGAQPPSRFFGIVPQAALAPADPMLMRLSGIGVLRTPVDWSLVEREPGEYDWHGLDNAVGPAAREGIAVLPYFYGTPAWLARRPTELPIANGGQRHAWAAFLQAAVARYGPGGSFWAEHGPGSAEPLPSLPIRTWQIWNEPNFFYFATPASPKLYGNLLKISAPAIRSVDGSAKVLIGGLFGRPRARPPRAMPAAVFLRRLYRIRGIRRFFDGVALHPYAANLTALRRNVWQTRRAMLKNRDGRTALHITELGWSSRNNPRRIAFEVGRRGQARELRTAYGFLIERRGVLNLKSIYWFSWKDAPRGVPTCRFCGTAGLLHAADRPRAKPAWHAFVAITGGQGMPPRGSG